MFERHVADRLSAFHEGQLSAEESSRIAEHLKSCERCKRKYEEIKLGISLANHLPLVSAPSSLWDEMRAVLEHAEQDSTTSGAQISIESLRWWRKATPTRIFVSAALGILFVTFGLWLYQRSFPRVDLQVNLDRYLTGVEHSSPEASYGAISGAPEDFVPVEKPRALRAARIEHVSESAPLPDYRLVAHRIRTVARSHVVQLVYRKDGEAFSVFVAPESVKFLFGKRDVAEAQVGRIACRRIDCPRVSTFWFGAGGLHCVLVSRSSDVKTFERIIEYFVSAHKPSG